MNAKRWDPILQLCGAFRCLCTQCTAYCNIVWLTGDLWEEVTLRITTFASHTSLRHWTKLFVLFIFPSARWFPSSGGRTSESARPKQNCTHKEVLNIRQFLLDHRKQKELAQGIGIEEDDTEDLGNTVWCLYEDKTGNYISLLCRFHIIVEVILDGTYQYGNWVMVTTNTVWISTKYEIWDPTTMLCICRVDQ